jgi:hypothetical protein
MKLQHHPRIKTVRDFLESLAAGPTTDLGGYPIFFIMADAEPLSYEAARDEMRIICRAMMMAEQHPETACNSDVRQWRPMGVAINYEDSSLFCCHTEKKIPCAYSED